MLACMLAAPRRDYARLGAETGPPAVTVSSEPQCRLQCTCWDALSVACRGRSFEAARTGGTGCRSMPTIAA
jgi:hypothetical protein